MRLARNLEITEVARSRSWDKAHRGAGFLRIAALVSLLLATLCMVGPLELLSSSVVPTYDLVADSSGPGSFLGNGASVARAPHDVSARNNEVSALPFGLDTEPVTEGELSDKWRGVAAGIAKDLEVIAQCQARKPCPDPARKLIDLSMEGASRGERARVGLINRAVDLAISPMSDEAQWGISDHWSDPLETLYTNAGDCEDYAIVKYAALLAAGFSKDAVKIVILTKRWPDEDHAVVAVWVDYQWLILDNLTLTLVRDTDVTRAIPKFVLDDRGVRRFIENERNSKADTPASF